MKTTTAPMDGYFLTNNIFFCHRKSMTKAGYTKDTKYASKLVGRVLDRLIEAHLSSKKKPSKMTEKWLNKMKLNVQKKVSLLSKETFVATQTSVKSLKADVAAMRAELVSLSHEVKAAAKETLEKSSGLLIPRSSTSSSSDHTQFDEQVASLGSSFENIAKSVSSLGEKLTKRVNDLTSTLNQTERNWEESKRMDSIQRVETVKAGTNPMKVLQEHLAKE
jgi:hypothetical protein